MLVGKDHDARLRQLHGRLGLGSAPCRLFALACMLVALGTLGFGLFGMGLGHLGYIANDDDYRPILSYSASGKWLHGY